MSNFAKDTSTMDVAWKLYDAERMANELLRKQLAASQAREAVLREALEFMYDKWENGTACYEEHEGFVGNAFTLDNDDENRILRLIPSCLNGNRIPQDTSAPCRQ